MPRLSIPETRELYTLEAVAKAGSEGALVVHRAGPAEITGATAEALTRKGYVEVRDSSPRRAFLNESGINRLDELYRLAGKPQQVRS